MQVLARRRGYTLVEFLVVLGIVTILAAILYPVTQRTHCSPYRVSCQSNLKQVGLAFYQYVQDTDERFPPVAIGSAQSYGWADALQPYLKATMIYRCPTRRNPPQKTSNFLTLEYWSQGKPEKADFNASPKNRGYTDYWMNANFSRVELKNVYAPAQSILSGDGNDGTDITNARYSLRSLPQAWRQDEKSPAYRHLDTMNILYADGHVKALKAERVVTGVLSNGAHATFAAQWRE